MLWCAAKGATCFGYGGSPANELPHDAKPPPDETVRMDAMISALQQIGVPQSVPTSQWGEDRHCPGLYHPLAGRSALISSLQISPQSRNMPGHPPRSTTTANRHI